jgi:hypothetical protein
VPLCPKLACQVGPASSGNGHCVRFLTVRLPGEGLGSHRMPIAPQIAFFGEELFDVLKARHHLLLPFLAMADDAGEGRVLGEEMHCGVVEAFDRVLHFLMGCGSQGTCMVRK